MSKPFQPYHYTVGAGRAILRDGFPILNLQRMNQALSPAEADEFTRQVAHALNACELLIHPDHPVLADGSNGGDGHLQRVIDLARLALGLDPAT